MSNISNKNFSFSDFSWMTSVIIFVRCGYFEILDIQLKLELLSHARNQDRLKCSDGAKCQHPRGCVLRAGVPSAVPTDTIRVDPLYGGTTIAGG
jgi:hypothetical protein